MPIYQYRCSACHQETEVLLKRFNAPHPTDCPECGGVYSLTQCVTAPGVRFSGQGYYETDEKPKDKRGTVSVKS